MRLVGRIVVALLVFALWVWLAARISPLLIVVGGLAAIGVLERPRRR